MFVLTSYVKVVDRLMSVVYLVGATAVGLMMIHVTVHVVLQYFFSAPLPGTMLFVSNYYMVGIVFLCVGLVERRDRHIRVDVATSILPGFLLRATSILSSLLAIVVYGAIGWQSFNIASRQLAIGAYELEYGLRFLLWPSYFVIPIGAALMVLALTARLTLDIANRSEAKAV